MPTRILIPVAAFTILLKLNEWHSTQRRFHQHNFTREHNATDRGAFSQHTIDRARPRFIRIIPRHEEFHKDFQYERYLNYDRNKVKKYAKEEDLRKVGVPYNVRGVFISRDDILLKADILNGKREKQRYDYSDLVELPFYYKRWQKRTKEHFDQEARDYADAKPAVYGTPYWPGMKSSDL